MRKHSNTPNKTCENCGDDFYAAPYRADVAKFCSYRCYWLSKQSIPVPEQGERSGLLTSLGIEKKVKSRRHVKCVCDCGKVKWVSIPKFHHRETKSCGCSWSDKAILEQRSRDRFPDRYVTYPNPEDPTGMSVLVKLTKGQFAIIDKQDEYKVMDRMWYAANPIATGEHYALSDARVGDNSPTLLMHQVILGVSGGVHVDHIDGNPLNNTRANLRVATKVDNARNRGGAFQ